MKCGRCGSTTPDFSAGEVHTFRHACRMGADGETLPGPWEVDGVWLDEETT